jgi:hypothetical protein
MNKAIATKFYRLAAIDLDDTLLGPDKRISAENATAVKFLQSQGVRIVLASGRRHENILRFHQQLDLRGPIVSSHGALVKDAETGTILQQHLVPIDLSAKVIADGLARDMTLICYRTNGVYVSERNALTALYQQRSGERIIADDELLANLQEAPLKIIWCGNPERIAAIYQTAKETYQEVLNITPTDPEYLEFTALRADKAVGVAAAARYYGVEQTAVIAFGDGNNDVPLLAWAGLGVAMSNARPHAKAAAALVSPSGNPETSFARAVATVFIL